MKFESCRRNLQVSCREDQALGAIHSRFISYVINVYLIRNLFAALTLKLVAEVRNLVEAGAIVKDESNPYLYTAHTTWKYTHAHIN